MFLLRKELDNRRNILAADAPNVTMHCLVLLFHILLQTEEFVY